MTIIVAGWTVRVAPWFLLLLLALVPGRLAVWLWQGR